MAILIDGLKLSKNIREFLKQRVTTLKEQNGGRGPNLAVIMIGNDESSKIYIRNKIKTCEYIGVSCATYFFPHHIGIDNLLYKIHELNNDADVNGILVQLPLPSTLEIYEEIIFKNILPTKDVDCLTPYNLGCLNTKLDIEDEYMYLPCTAQAIVRLIHSTNTRLEGKKCVILNRSKLVGRPLANLLLNQDATVTVCHSKTEGLIDECRRADVLIVALGKIGFVTKDMIKKGAIVIDAGIHRNVAGKICGDVDFNSVGTVASYITPVPGGVGPMTILCLIDNCIKAFKNNTLYVGL